MHRVNVTSMLRMCCENVANAVAYNIQHQEFSSLIPMLRLYCFHVAIRVACNIQHQESSPPPPRHKLNITCLQHRNSTPATLKFNICDTQQHLFATSILSIYSIKKLTFATRRINIRNIETSKSTLTTSARNTCNILLKHTKHVKTHTCNMHQNSTKKSSAQGEAGGRRMTSAPPGSHQWSSLAPAGELTHGACELHPWLRRLAMSTSPGAPLAVGGGGVSRILT
jgi:hypothetical protein